jgi:co-chaperonin GroES (HSP10)
MKQLILLITLLTSMNYSKAEELPHSAFTKASDLLIEIARERASHLAITMHKTRLTEEKVNLYAGKFLEDEFSDYFGTYETKIVQVNGTDSPRVYSISCQISAHVYKSHLKKVDIGQEVILDQYEEFEVNGDSEKKMILAKYSVSCKLK